MRKPRCFRGPDLVPLALLLLGLVTVRSAASDSWERFSAADIALIGPIPNRSFSHTAVWTGTEMIVWAGNFYADGGIPRSLRSGARYSPATNTWTPMTTTNSPPLSSAAVWNGESMVVAGPTGADKIHAYSPFPHIEFQTTRTLSENNTLTLEFPSLLGRTYTLWGADSLTSGSWTDTGLPSLSGNGGTLNFLVPISTPALRFFRIQSAP